MLGPPCSIHGSLLTKVSSSSLLSSSGGTGGYTHVDICEPCSSDPGNDNGTPEMSESTWMAASKRSGSAAGIKLPQKLSLVTPRHGKPSKGILITECVWPRMGDGRLQMGKAVPPQSLSVALPLECERTSLGEARGSCWGEPREQPTSSGCEWHRGASLPLSSQCVFPPLFRLSAKSLGRKGSPGQARW